MPSKSTVSRDGIEAASRTYIRCTGLLRKEFGVPSTGADLGPRDTFEETVTYLRAKFERESGQEAELTQADFSSNEVVRLMMLTALNTGTPKRRRLKRAEFIRLVNVTLQEDGGLKVVRRWHAGAENGRYAWIDSHMSVLLRRHADVVSRSKRYPGELWVGRSSTNA